MKVIKGLTSFVLAFALLFSLVSCSGSPSIEIGENGNWWIDGEDTGVYAKGDKGDSGEKGETGSTGEKGDKGDKGDDGKSAYELYCEEYGYTGTEEQWLAEINLLIGKLSPEQIYKIAYNATVAIECYDRYGELIGTGSGFFISADGRIATAYHVIDGAYSIKARMQDESTTTVSTVVGFDIQRDIAILKVQSTLSFSYLKCDTGGITPGEAAYSFGSPLGFLDGSFSSGVVSSNFRNEIIDSDTGESYKVVQFTAPVSQGNSGGPLLNSYGKVIGIVTSKYTYGEDLNLATYVAELENIDTSYNKPVSQFYDDTVFFQTKLFESKCDEIESNDTIASADSMGNGDSYLGVAVSADSDFYKIYIAGTENVMFTIAFVILEENEYVANEPILTRLSGSKISIEWTSYDLDGMIVYYAHGYLSPDTYYVEMTEESDVAVAYYLYAHWQAESVYERVNSVRSVEETDFIP